ncbi:MAG: bifunctional 5,10-methylene-tetrahydrofolate dehydrogenase/5,10-methylene-tetrahydrofolate cyclohydrolase [Gammaproteobacteria bacterium TMED260]|jgi:methylenetetrahydrofolate dehydrogenase (NADP+)/methenyltetrahydrofolate cyclohydrolase|nr:bifunctional 5,10-methylene-tetrahydrofolate dehydrogenase/5,10-methylene-tetrahydrofolate cyclohydrolase [Gammaproteobacteria bacterium]MAV53715.1 bifunctional 5,10-methylene-tetrahydrofolate dehydrogenase/5,10-methylene-tetrahydrofolate cyclohydrolase [Gammaproteobacteria bacterium]OUX33234.1 MAG: bifunctional 5,10-methylene-tetrahydrofolate dehydrogenase/5,10-methylene-tetrahydrofolate cyclohydrolase [Gammaproteobacteria bacterium TMED260]|tara:strand:+ start:1201 stop:2082 length:882 start_codon:yes stop_codon:yes gene_type:complete
MQLLDGTACSQQIRKEIATEVEALITQGKRAPHLAAVLVGDDGASQNYVGMKVRDCEEVGFGSTTILLDANTTEDELLAKIAELNADDGIDGFIVQLPLPPQIDENKVILAIDPSKDVDGFCPENVGNLSLGLPTFISATPNGIMELLRRYKVETGGKHCVVLGRSNIVGTPMAVLMSRNTNPGNATVTIAHSRTKNLKEVCLSADILIVAIGKTEFVTADMVKPGAVVIDVGQTRVPDSSRKSGFRNVGDVDFENVKDKCSYITYVTGGVGPMTRASLLQNTLKACQRRSNS